MRITGIGGGVGASRLWRALTDVVPARDLTLVVNTGDDLWHHGLRVCPDLDTVLYALSSRQDVARGWGVLGESWRAMDALRGLGQDVWFQLGDLDLATHLLRTGLLRDGVPLSEVTARLARGMRVGMTVLPMSDEEVSTRIGTADGRDLHYEEFFVREAAAPAVRAVHYDGAADAAPAPGVLEAIAGADLVVLGPSNPLSSLDPVLAVPGVRDALTAARGRTTAVTSIVTGAPLPAGEQRRATSRAALLASAGLAATATTVAGRYRDVAARFVLDAADAGEAGAIRDLGLDVAVVPTMLHQGAPPGPLLAALGVASTGQGDHSPTPSPPGGCGEPLGARL